MTQRDRTRNSRTRAASAPRIRSFGRMLGAGTAALLAGIAWHAFSATQAASAETEVPLEPISGSPGIPAMVFYGLGALLVVGAIILYLLRRRR